jgi:transcriptional regulator
MGSQRNDILQGTLVLLVLRTLASQRRMHGYAITAHIQRVSSDLLRVEEGSLYPALHRIEERGYVDSDWGTSENNRRARYYRLTRAGRKRLEAEAGEWKRLSLAITRVMEA